MSKKKKPAVVSAVSDANAPEIIQMPVAAPGPTAGANDSALTAPRPQGNTPDFSGDKVEAMLREYEATSDYDGRVGRILNAAAEAVSNNTGHVERLFELATSWPQMLKKAKATAKTAEELAGQNSGIVRNCNRNIGEIVRHMDETNDLGISIERSSDTLRVNVAKVIFETIKAELPSDAQWRNEFRPLATFLAGNKLFVITPDRETGGDRAPTTMSSLCHSVQITIVTLNAA